MPWMFDQRGEGERVAGEVYEVDDAALAEMDRLERVGHSDGYRRAAILVEVPGATLDAFAYLKPMSQFDPAEVRAGPLAEYTLEHARLYRPRAASSQA